MRRVATRRTTLVFGIILLLGGGTASAEDVSGIISSTRMITEDNRTPSGATVCRRASSAGAGPSRSAPNCATL